MLSYITFFEFLFLFIEFIKQELPAMEKKKSNKNNNRVLENQKCDFLKLKNSSSKNNMK